MRASFADAGAAATLATLGAADDGPTADDLEAAARRLSGLPVVAAAGRYDGYWERGIQPWDMAAGIILVREAGGFVSGIRDGDDPVETGSIIAGNSALFEDFRKVIRGE